MDTSQNEETLEANDSSIDLEDLFNDTFIQLDTTTELREEEVVGEDVQNKTSYVEEEGQPNMVDSDEEVQPSTDLSANQNQVNRMIFTDLVTNIRIRTTKTNRQQYQWLGTLAELEDFFGLALERQGTWSQRQLKGTSKRKNPEFVYTFCASFEESKALWHANGTLQLQGNNSDNVKMDVNQLLGEKIRTDVKDNDIPLRVDQNSERIKKLWEAISQIKLDLTRIKKATPHLDDQNGNFRVKTAVISVDENQKRITDFFSHATKDESLDSVPDHSPAAPNLKNLKDLNSQKRG